MKTLPDVAIGNRNFKVTAAHAGGSVISVTVKCGEDALTGKLNHQGTHDHSEEQFDKDVADFAQRLAGELANSLRSRELAEKFGKP